MSTDPIELHFESRLRASPERAWAWATSVDGILTELRPLARMTVPAGTDSLLDLDVELGKPIARSWILLFGVLPVDRSDLTLVELEPGRRFVEQSPMLGMRLWRHERTIEPVGASDAGTAGDAGGDASIASAGCRITDHLTFEPRLGRPLVRWLVAVLFRHRHRVLRRELGELAG